MKYQTRRGSVEADGWMFILVCGLMLTLGIYGGACYGFNQGVRACAKGEYVVTQLPDGTDVVTKAKGAK